MNENSNREYMGKDDDICTDIRVLLDMIVPLVSSYRLLAGAANELNNISAVSKHDLKEAVERTDDMGEIIDDMQDELHKVIKQYLKEINYKLKKGSNNDVLNINSSEIQFVELE
jgi:hypothetical protein